MGFVGAPRVVGPGFSPDGRETLSYIEAEPGPHPQAWSDEDVWNVGLLLGEAHRALQSFVAPDWATWLPWWGRNLSGGPRIFGHCDAAPWNFLVRDRTPIALVDWDTAGPVGQLWDVAQAAWLNAQLHDDDVAERVGLPSATRRIRQVRVFCDGYGLDPVIRRQLPGAMIEVAIRTSAQEAIDAGVAPDSVKPCPVGRLGGGDPLSGHTLLWAVTWRARSARWMLDHRAPLERILD